MLHPVFACALRFVLDPLAAVEGTTARKRGPSGATFTRLISIILVGAQNFRRHVKSGIGACALSARCKQEELGQVFPLGLPSSQPVFDNASDSMDRALAPHSVENAGKSEILLISTEEKDSNRKKRKEAAASRLLARKVCNSLGSALSVSI
jgi:hypothetical protein